MKLCPITPADARSPRGVRQGLKLGTRKPDQAENTDRGASTSGKPGARTTGDSDICDLCCATIAHNDRFGNPRTNRRAVTTHTTIVWAEQSTSLVSGHHNGSSPLGTASFLLIVFAYAG